MNVRGLAGQYVAFVGLWLFFSAQVTKAEIVAGLMASAITLAILRATLRALPLCFQPKVRWFAGSWQLPALIGHDLWILLRYLARRIARKPSAASMELEPFDAAAEDCRTSARRALGLLFMSIAPNSIALYIDRARSQMLVHQLERAPMPPLVERLKD